MFPCPVICWGSLTLRIMRHTDESRGDKKRILILGGGFAGVYAAMYFEKECDCWSEWQSLLVLAEIEKSELGKIERRPSCQAIGSATSQPSPEAGA